MSMSRDDVRIWTSLRERSLQPGGFGEDRARIWPALLGAQPLSDPPPYSEMDDTNNFGNLAEEGTDKPMVDPHTDERQIKLDTDRSFVLYPGESGTTPARDTLQSDLHELLVSLFRKRRSLHYFQGFHDLMTVIFLTLPRPLHLACAEKMALHRVRDSMGVGLEPVLGLLRVLRNLLRLADPAYAKLLENTSPLPYHALSHLLTLFSHDVPTLPLIQHVWDFLLSREPIAVVWLAAALILHRKPSVYLLAEQDEEGMIHSLLGGIPELVDAAPDFGWAGAVESTVTKVNRVAEDETIPVKPAACSRSNSEACTHGHSSSGAIDETLGSQQACTTLTGNEGELDQSSPSSETTQNSNMLQASNSSQSTELNQLADAADKNCVSDTQNSNLELAKSIPLPVSRPSSPMSLPGLSSSTQPSTSPQEVAPVNHHDPSPSSPDHVSLRSRLSSDLGRPPSMADESPFVLDKPIPSKSRTKHPPLSLTYLLRQADDLLTAYPPSHPSLRVSETLGPDSAMRTWRPLSINTSAVPEKQPYNYTDDYLETLVNSSYIVIPSPPPSPNSRLTAKKMKASPRTLSKALLDPRRIGQRLGALTPAERRVLFMGALFVVGVAMALKSSKVPCAESIAKTGNGDGVKRLWNGKWTFISSVVAAWGRGLP